jgi:P27 family predicted phage terminase small subunit
MKAGQRPMPTQLKLLRGNPGKQRLPANEPQPEQAIDVPAPPAFITGYAADEWWVVAVELHRLGLLTKVDVAPLAAYCHAYGQWRMAAESLSRMAANAPIMNGQIIKTKYGDAAANPCHKSIVVLRPARSGISWHGGVFRCSEIKFTFISSPTG